MNTCKHTKNILLFHPDSPEIGGVDSVLLQLVELSKDIDPSLKFFIVLPPGNPNVTRYRQARVQVFEMANLGYFTKSDSFPMIMKTLLSMPNSYNKIKRIIFDNHINIVHSHKINAFLGCLAAKGAHVKAVHTYHEVNTGSLWVYRIFNFLIELFTDKIIILCEATGELISGNWHQHSKVCKIYNGIDIHRFSPGVGKPGFVRQELGLPENAPVVVALSRIHKTKGLEYYIDAACKILNSNSRVHFLMVGDVSERTPELLKYRRFLLQRIAEKGIGANFHFTGVRQDVLDIYSLANVFVLPSVFDVLPTTILEAMAMQLPIVATKVGGVAEQVIDGETGYLVPPADVNSLADRIIDVLDNSERSQEMGRLGRKRVLETFSQSSYVANTISLYDQVLCGCGVKDK